MTEVAAMLRFTINPLSFYLLLNKFRIYIKFFNRELPDLLSAELEECLSDNPGNLPLFLALSQADQMNWIKHSYSEEDIGTRYSRILKLLEFLKYQT